ncbi:MAG: hypothetical protein GY801_51130 [bacterium]|nr:hypothetical protein [bacterium]
MQHTVTITIPEPLESRIQVIDDFDTYASVITVEALQNQDKQAQKKQLAEAAQLMLHDYEHDDELTVFTALDGEPLHE